jgi:hypothetical protein
MPRINEQLLDSSIYLYNSVKAAEDGDQIGGSGFIVHVPTKYERWVHPYAVTNKHLIDGGFHVLRLNTIEGGINTIESEPESWRLHPDGDDIAVLPLELDGLSLKWLSIPTTQFISRDIIENYRVGPGDEVFLIGRLVTMAGRQKNSPVVRFGNLSMMANPDEPIVRSDGSEQESFLVDCRSLSGFSGSPVFVTTTQYYDESHLPKVLESGEPIPGDPPNSTSTGIRATLVSTQGTFGPWLLGIDWGHVPLWKPVYEGQRKTDYQADANTGIACVAPAWRILDVLNDKELLRERSRDNERFERVNRAI